jgi:hypothetical protein
MPVRHAPEFDSSVVQNRLGKRPAMEDAVHVRSTLSMCSSQYGRPKQNQLSTDQCQCQLVLGSTIV